MSPRFLALPALALAACQPVPLPLDTGDGSDGGSDSVTTLASLRQGGADSGDSVRVGDLVVTTPRSMDGAGLYGSVFYVQDRGGGEHGAARVRLAGTFEDLALSVGQGLEVQGTWVIDDEVVEIVVSDADDLAPGDALEDVSVTSLDPALLAEEDPSGWVAVLVQLPAQQLTACPDAFGQVALDSGLVLDDVFVDYPAGRDATVTSLTAVLQPALGQWLALPRSQDDLADFEAGQGCSSTVQELRERADEGGSAWAEEVELPQLVATSGQTSRQPHGFFVQQPGGGERSGLFVQSEEQPAPGDLLAVSGRAWLDEGFVVLDADEVTASGDSQAPVVAVLTELPADWAPWQGALVSLADPQTTEDPDAIGQCALGADLTLGSWFLPCTASAGTTFSSVTGLLSESSAGLALHPRDDTDLAPTEADRR